MANPTVPVYTDPKSGIQVMGWMVTDVVDTSTVYNSIALNVYQVTVTVNYKFKGRAYSVKMNTLRSSDI